MANRYAVANGNWSDPSTWDGLTTVPTSADDVYANNRTVTIDVSATVLSIRNTATTGVTAGGSFTLTSGTVLTCTATNGLVSTGAVLVNVNFTSGQSAQINGNIGFITTPSIPNQSAVTVSALNTGTLNIVGNLTGVTGSGNVALANNSVGTVNITGNILALGGNNCPCVTNSGTINITGNVTGGSVPSGFNPAEGIRNSGTLNITGNVFGGSSTNTNYGVIGSGTVTIIGTLQASASIPALNFSGTAFLTGPFIGTAQGIIANQAIRWRWIQAVGSSYMTVPNSTATGYKNLYTADSTLSNSGQPGISSVRLGTIYGPNSELTGTLAMPLPSQVYYGVAVGNTTGTAALNVADIWNYPITGITTSGSIGERLKTAATVNVMGQLISDSFSAK